MISLMISSDHATKGAGWQQNCCSRRTGIFDHSLPDRLACLGMSRAQGITLGFSRTLRNLEIVEIHMVSHKYPGIWHFYHFVDTFFISVADDHRSSWEIPATQPGVMAMAPWKIPQLFTEVSVGRSQISMVNFPASHGADDTGGYCHFTLESKGALFSHVIRHPDMPVRLAAKPR